MYKNNSKIKTSVLRSNIGLVFALSILLLIGGCASNLQYQPGSAHLASRGEASTQNEVAKLVIFQDEGDRQRLTDIGILGRFLSFWQAYIDRDWLKRRSLESISASMSDSFYARYHSKAWPVKAIKIEKIEYEASTVRLLINLSLINPESGVIEVHHRAETWRRGEIDWLHINQDPLFAPSR